ncbi:MAG: hypothetical protein ACR9NN_15625 [Nostochopsis sp.]
MPDYFSSLSQERSPSKNSRFKSAVASEKLLVQKCDRQLRQLLV